MILFNTYLGTVGKCSGIFIRFFRKPDGVNFPVPCTLLNHLFRGQSMELFWVVAEAIGRKEVFWKGTRTRTHKSIQIVLAHGGFDVLRSGRGQSTVCPRTVRENAIVTRCHES